MGRTATDGGAGVELNDCHQYVRRSDGRVVSEPVFRDRDVRRLYARVRERAPWVFRACTCARATDLFALASFDSAWARRFGGLQRFLRDTGISLDDALHPAALRTPRDVFERKIRYQECRPMPSHPAVIVAPADARMVPGSFRETDLLYLKDKFFSFDELLGAEAESLTDKFRGGDFAVFRLTPDKYHYNHCPVSGRVVSFYEVPGVYHSCNPSALLEVPTAYSKNRRMVTIIDTDVEGGTGVGFVAMLEVVAMMIGRIQQTYSESGYDDPQDLRPGMHLQRGRPKSLYAPGSSTDVLLFEPGRMRFDEDLIENRKRRDVRSRYSLGFGECVVETDLQVRESIGRAVQRGMVS